MKKILNHIHTGYTKALLLLWLAMPVFTVFSQAPQADFTSTSAIGCMPLTVTFTDESAGNPNNWNWDFGNGQLSTQKNNTITYTQPGIYSVRLVVRNASGINSITKTDYIIVSESPVVNFSADRTSGCAGSSFTFTDASVPPANVTIDDWLWDFGDGQTATGNTVTHDYAQQGNYNVSLTVTTSSGCQITATKYNFIQVVNVVKADFSNTLPPTCRPPFVVNFSNLSTGGGNLTYLWTLDNGTSTEASPSISYNSGGTYSVKLVANSNLGCSDSITKTISFNAVSTNFTNTTACENTTISFQNTSDAIPISSVWTLGDGVQGSGDLITHSYATVGVYPVKLINIYPTCTDSTIVNVVVQPTPIVDFTANQLISCEAPFSVDFQNTTPNAVELNWTFGDGNISTGTTTSNNYTTEGAFPVTLSITDGNGCSASATKTDFIRIASPTLSVTGALGGCASFSYTPVVAVVAIDGISNYSWDFGAGPVQSGPTPNQSYTYNTPGDYPVQLTITTNQGCSKTFNATVSVGTPPASIDFTADQTLVCPFSNIQFTASSATPGVQWQWDFGDGRTATGVDPQHDFRDTGYFDITLTAINNGCPTSVTKTEYLKVQSPVAQFSSQIDCTSGRTVSFINQTKTDAQAGVIDYSWTFGDGNTSTAENPSNTYSTTTDYTVTLTATSTTIACSNSVTQTVQILNETADFQISKASVCKGERFTLTALANPTRISSYQWIIGALPAINRGPTIQYTINNNGIYNTTLKITDINGCTHEVTQQQLINVSGPTAAFVTDAVTCGNDNAVFTDQSLPTNTINTWEWDFGDGNIQSFTQPPFTHQYADTGVYTVKLKTTDANGCSHTINKNNAITISRPQAKFSKDTTFWCPAVPVIFTDSSKGKGLTYLWDFGDGNTSSEQNPVNIFPTAENDYTISLKVTDNNGCSDLLKRDQYIQTRFPKASFAVSDTITICAPLIAKFRFTGSDHQSISWDFDDGSAISTQSDPQHPYTNYGDYAPVLTASGNGGCFATSTTNIQVLNPNTTQFDYLAPETCNQINVNFSIAPPAGTRFIVYFGDGSTDSTQSPQVSHQYGSPAYFNPYLTLRDSSGCVATIRGNTQVRVIGAEPLFGMDADMFCDPRPVNFIDYTIGNDPVTEYNWDFGDNNNSMETNPVNDYTSPGIYLPTLTVSTQSGCSSSFTDSIIIYRTPTPVINNKDLACVNSPISFLTTVSPQDTAVSFSWSFSDGTTSIKKDPIKIFNTAGNAIATLTATIPFGCSATIPKQIEIVPLPVIDKMPDQTILAGQSVTLPAIYSPGVNQYLWKPAADLDCNTCPNPLASPKNNKTYEITATDVNGCQSTSNITVIVTCNNNNFFIPNTFSPNGDGANDYFYPRGKGLVRIQSLRVFNRWGELVFEKKDFVPNSSSSGWNGTYKGKPAISDVYIYNIEIICENSTVIPFKGNVMLLR